MRIFNKNEKGFTVLAAVGVMMILSIFGFYLSSIVTTASAVHTDTLVYDRSFYVNQAGLEYAMRKISEGVSAVVPPPGVSFAGGTFTVTHEGNIVTVTSTYGDSSVTHIVTSPSEADCTDFNVDNASLIGSGNTLNQIHFEKICLWRTTLDKVLFTWTPTGTEGLERIRVENSTLYHQPAVLSGTITELADYVMYGGNQNNFNQIDFTGNMEGKDFTVTFILGDGSSETYEFSPD